MPCSSHQATNFGLRERRIFPRDLFPGLTDPELQNRFDLGKFHLVDANSQMRRIRTMSANSSSSGSQESCHFIQSS